MSFQCFSHLNIHLVKVIRPPILNTANFLAGPTTKKQLTSLLELNPSDEWTHTNIYISVLEVS